MIPWFVPSKHLQSGLMFMSRCDIQYNDIQYNDIQQNCTWLMTYRNTILSVITSKHTKNNFMKVKYYEAPLEVIAIITV
jgi:hypothetical protein